MLRSLLCKLFKLVKSEIVTVTVGQLEEEKGRNLLLHKRLEDSERARINALGEARASREVGERMVQIERERIEDLKRQVDWLAKGKRVGVYSGEEIEGEKVNNGEKKEKKIIPPAMDNSAILKRERNKFLKSYAEQEAALEFARREGIPEERMREILDEPTISDE